ncbi:MAG: DNA gyrase subunit A [Lachnospiraceae bacterium]|nr:DNA gyrase subunit A [Lachnospiraceae bacterium]
MEDNIFDKNIQDADLKVTMENSYIDYAMSVIVARALPDARDGLKPVQRRILHALNELSNTPDKPHRKCARIVGDTMGKYHPHGDSSIYGALVNLAQPWSTRYPLVDGHGNFGSVDGDGAAAMRYTEARLSKISMEMLADINKDTVDMEPNFDDTEKEPAVLPSRIPNLLVNGGTGIAVGMATNIPPHNLGEVVNAVVKIIDNKIEDRETAIEELLSIVKGPDFPTGAVICGKRGINDAYRTGRGKVIVRAVTDIEPMANGKNRIVVTELPYMVNKAKLIENIAELVRDKKVDGITEIRDESNKEGVRVCIELRRDVNPSVVLNKLYKHTKLQDTFGVIMLALVENQPKVLNLLEALSVYLKHQEEVVTRRTRYDLNKAEERAHIIEGLLKALDVIDEVIRLIRAAKSTQEAKESLISAFGFDDAQAQAIVDMRLRQLTGLEREKLVNEFDELQKKIAEYRAILGDEKVLLATVKKEILAISEKYSDERRTQIGADSEEILDEDMIPVENTVVAMTRRGYIKRMTIDNFRSQQRGGKGVKGMQTIDDDNIVELFMTSTHDYIMFITSKGRAYRIRAYEIPEASRTARGTAIVNLIPLQGDEKITAGLSLTKEDVAKSPVIPDGVEDETVHEGEKFLLMATKNGTVKKTRLSEFANIRKSGIQAISLRDDDVLIGVKLTDGKSDAMLITQNGMCIRFNEEDVRFTGRSSMGVIGMTLTDDEVIEMILTNEGTNILFVSENGLGKLTAIDEFTAQHRGGKGVKCYKLMERSGVLVAAKAVDTEGEVMLITTEGVVIRIPISGISVLGRNTTGVKLINMGKSNTVAGVTKVLEDDDVESILEE